MKKLLLKVQKTENQSKLRDQFKLEVIESFANIFLIDISITDSLSGLITDSLNVLITDSLSGLNRNLSADKLTILSL